MYHEQSHTKKKRYTSKGCVVIVNPPFNARNVIDFTYELIIVIFQTEFGI